MSLRALRSSFRFTFGLFGEDGGSLVTHFLGDHVQLVHVPDVSNKVMSCLKQNIYNVWICLDTICPLFMTFLLRIASSAVLSKVLFVGKI